MNLGHGKEAKETISQWRLKGDVVDTFRPLVILNLDFVNLFICFCLEKQFSSKNWIL